jgi:hypothetical protein
MSRFFPHTPYAEDQPLSHTILNVHVLTRGLTTGTLIASLITAGRQLIPSRRLAAPAFASRLLLSSSTGALIGVGLSALATTGRMWGRDEIEWKDRSWRLMENRSQLRLDDFTYVSMAAAPIVLAARRGTLAVGWRSFVGVVGLGSVVGMVGHMAFKLVSDPEADGSPAKKEEQKEKH